MRDSEYEFIRTLVYEHSRINLGPDKRELVSARLGKRLRATNLASISEYCRFLKDNVGGNGELEQLIDVISTNHTFFFRETPHFEFIRSHIVPEMLDRQRTERWSRFYAWSAASSSGEEGYSLAITLEESLAASCWTWHIEGTDISHRVLEKARAGIYREDVVGKLPPAMLRNYFQRGVGPQAGNYRVRAQLRDRFSLQRLNLLEGEPPFRDPFHLIMCRNVMIYFDRPTQEELVQKLTRRLVPGGYLLVGHSESLTGIKHGLQMVRPAIYRRPPVS